MSVEAVAEDFKIEGHGLVVLPPTAEELSARICEAADRKESLILSASELRVLADLISQGG